MIRFELKLPTLPPIPPMPNLGRYILITVVVVSMLMSATSIYVTLAAPQHSTYVPTTIGFEGQLADAQGTPVADGSYSITFNLYNAASGGSPVWTETQPDVDVKDGLYSVQLGSVTAFGADTFNGGRWLGIKVGNDAEMAPRISVGAVPFALNAKYAQGLQNNPVADTAPSANNALMWSGSQWEPKGMTLPDLSAVGSNASPNDLLANYRSGAILTWKDANAVTVAPGELMVSGYTRRNASAVDVKFTADAGGNGPNRGLDTGTAQSNTTYYIYAVADDAESTFDLIISASASAPTGVTNARKLGSAATQTGNIDFGAGSITNVTQTPQSVPSVRVYNSASINVPYNTETTLTFNSERFDADNLHSTSTNTSRLTANRSGKYLIFANVAWPCVAGSGSRRLWLRVNGTTIIAFDYIGNQGEGGSLCYTRHSTETVYQLNSGDYVEVLVLQNDYMLTRTVEALGNYSPEFGMVWMDD